MQWKRFSKDSPRRVKPLLYVYRVLLTGIHLMRSGHIEANLVSLNELFQLAYVPDLIQRKMYGTEQGTLDNTDFEFTSESSCGCGQNLSRLMLTAGCPNRRRRLRR